jgi:DNA-binding NarL/FixJ family response regulator
MGIPLTIQLDGPTYAALETAAARKGVSMRSLVEQYLATSTRPKVKRDRAVHGVRLSPDQVREIRVMTASGASAQAIAVHLGCHYRTVENWRAKFAQEAKEAGHA